MYRDRVILCLVLLYIVVPCYGQWNNTVVDGVEVFTPGTLPDPGNLAPGAGLPSARVEIPGTANVTDNSASGVIIEMSYGGLDRLTLINNGTIDGRGNNAQGIVIDTAGGALVTNSGSILAGDCAIIFNSGAGTVVNFGTITSPCEGIIGVDALIVYNFGSISGDNAGILAVNSLNLVNRGTIVSQVSGVESGPGSMILNSGLVEGGVFGVMLDADSVLMNSGTIRTAFLEAVTTQFMVDNITIINSGLIDGSAGAGVCMSGNGLRVENTGTILSSDGAPGVQFCDGTGNVIINRTGTIISAHANAPAIALSPDGSNRALIGNFSILSGWIDGALTAGNELTFDFVGINPVLASQLRAQIAAQGGAGQITVLGQVFEWRDFLTAPVFSFLSFEESAQTPNQRAIGRTLDSFTSRPSQDMISVLSSLTVSGNIPGALDQLSPQRYELFSKIILNQLTFMTQDVDGYLSGIRGGASGFDFSRLSLLDKDMAFENLFAGVGDVSRSMSDVPARQPSPSKIRAVNAKKIGGYISGDLILAQAGAVSGIPQDLDYTTAGFSLGMDYRVMEKLVVGLMFSYGQTESDFNNAVDSLSIETYSPGLYAAWNHEGWYANGLLSYGWSELSQSRGIAFGGLNRQASGSTDGKQWVGNLTIGRDWKVGNFVVGPFLGMQYTHLEMNPFTETGAGALNLSVGRQETDSFRTKLGVGANYTAKIKSVTIQPSASIAWLHEFLDDSRGITAAFNEAGVGSFVVNTTEPERDSALVGVGLNVWWEDWIMLFGRYDAQAGQDNFFAQGLKGGVKVSF